MRATCSFCPSPYLESVIVDGRRNDNTEVVIYCCKEHLAEMENNCPAFEKKYSERIEELAAENGRTYEL